MLQSANSLVIITCIAFYLILPIPSKRRHSQSRRNPPSKIRAKQQVHRKQVFLFYLLLMICYQLQILASEPRVSFSNKGINSWRGKILIACTNRKQTIKNGCCYSQWHNYEAFLLPSKSSNTKSPLGHKRQVCAFLRVHSPNAGTNVYNFKDIRDADAHDIYQDTSSPPCFLPLNEMWIIPTVPKHLKLSRSCSTTNSSCSKKAPTCLLTANILTQCCS